MLCREVKLNVGDLFLAKSICTSASLVIAITQMGFLPDLLLLPHLHPLRLLQVQQHSRKTRTIVCEIDSRAKPHFDTPRISLYLKFSFISRRIKLKQN